VTRAARFAVGLLLVAAPVVAAAYPATLRIPPGKPRAVGTPPAALFSHKTHAGFGCAGCHPAVFPQAAVGFSHAEMSRGEFCGGCHDGELAFAITGAPCARCHVP
jgi:c(7)-type cytochrome triheme protein